MTPDKRKAETAPSITIRQKKRFRFLWLAAPVLIGLLLTTRSAWPDNHLFASLIQQFGAIYVFAFIAGRSWSTLYMGSTPDVLLITDGPYRHLRNPLYFFSATGLLGVGMLWKSLILGAGLFGFVLLTFYFVILGEEKFLENRFGDTFRAYCRAVPRLLPSLKARIPATHGETTPFSPSALWDFFRDTSWLLLVLPGSVLVDWAQRAGWLPVLLRLY